MFVRLDLRLERVETCERDRRDERETRHVVWRSHEGAWNADGEAAFPPLGSVKPVYAIPGEQEVRRAAVHQAYRVVRTKESGREGRLTEEYLEPIFLIPVHIRLKFDPQSLGDGVNVEGNIVVASVCTLKWQCSSTIFAGR